MTGTKTIANGAGRIEVKNRGEIFFVTFTQKEFYLTMRIEPDAAHTLSKYLKKPEAMHTIETPLFDENENEQKG